MLKFSTFRQLDKILQSQPQGKVEFTEVTPQQIKNPNFYREAGKAKTAVLITVK